MPSTIRITVCGGTACHLMGGSELQLLLEHLPERLRARVVVEGTPCLNHCRNHPGERAPFVQIEDEVVSNATLPEVLERLLARIEDEER